MSGNESETRLSSGAWVKAEPLDENELKNEATYG